MKSPTQPQHHHRIAFTLIELLVVIAVIGILAALLFPVISCVGVRRMISVAQTELNQVSTAIEAYKARKGHYPPENAASPYTPANDYANPLYFELVGTTLTFDNSKGGYIYLTLDGSHWIPTNNVRAALGVGGFVNAGANTRGSDDAPAPEAFLKELKPDQIGVTNGANVLVCSEGWSKPNASRIAPLGYTISHATNNPGSYDLWVDLYIRGKTYRFSNWTKQPSTF